MISGNTEIFKSPLRQISSKVEVINASTDAKSGKVVRLDGCQVGATLDVSIESETPEGLVLAKYGKNLLTSDEALVHYKRNFYVYAPDGSYNYWTDHPDDDELECYSTYYIPCSHLQGLTLTWNGLPKKVLGRNTNAGIAFYTEEKTSSFISGNNTNDTFTVPNNANYMRLTLFVVDYPNQQLELGDTITDFEAYKEPELYTINSDGMPESTINAFATNTLLVYENPDKVNYTINASYLVETPGQTYTNRDKIRSIKLERDGANKFFGFGILQKSIVKLTDKECSCQVAKGDRFRISFDEVMVGPSFTISDVKKDEKTRELTLTAFDKIADASGITIGSLPIGFTLSELVAICADKLKMGYTIPSLSEFSIYYEGDANLDGSESVREVLDAIAEATQTVYFANTADDLVFKRLGGDVAWEIDNSQYFDFDSKGQVVLSEIDSITELGDNLSAKTGSAGAIQHVRNNPLWELREDLPTLLENAIAAVGGMEVHQFTSIWRGNYLLEPGDKISLFTREGTELQSYLVSDVLEYTGGMRETTNWTYQEKDTEHTNPVSLGEALKQTYAKVDKVNREIEMAVSTTSSNAEKISQLIVDTSGISGAVRSLEQTTTEAFGSVNGELADLNKKVEVSMTEEQVRFEIETSLSNGVEKITTQKGFVFDDNGLSIDSSDNEISTTISEKGMTVKQSGNEVLTANQEGVKAIDLHATTFLIIGDYSRLQNHPGERRTACFWIGG